MNSQKAYGIAAGLAVLALGSFFVFNKTTPEQALQNTIKVIDAQKAQEIAKADKAIKEADELAQESVDYKDKADDLMALAASSADRSNRMKNWAASCIQANQTGTVAMANSCDLIPLEQPGTGGTATGITGPIPSGTGSTATGATATGSIKKPLAETTDGVIDPEVVLSDDPKDELLSEVDRSDSYRSEVARKLIWRYNANGFAQTPVGLTEESVEKRTKQILRAYKFDQRFGLTRDYGYEMFKKVGERYGVKPEMLVCVAKADSSLGRSLKTDNNIGNVGNNDRGNRVHLPNVGSGIDHIGLTLTNSNLGYKQSIGSLSPVGGGNKPFYATSQSGDWYNNVRNCVAEIHDDPTVGPDFSFRTRQCWSEFDRKLGQSVVMCPK